MEEKEPGGITFPEGTVQIPEGAPVTITRAPNMPTIYTNQAGFAVGAVDVRLFVGEQLLNPDGSGVTVVQRLCLIMSPEYAKLLAENLLQAMQSFEAQFGKLRDITTLKKTDQKAPRK